MKTLWVVLAILNILCIVANLYAYFFLGHHLYTLSTIFLNVIAFCACVFFLRD